MLIISSLLQAFLAIRTILKGIPFNNHKIYKAYFVSKVLNVSLIFIQTNLLDLFNCIIYCNIHEEKCSFKNLSPKLIIGFIWVSFESYLCYVVYCFYIKTLKGRYGLFGSPPIFDINLPFLQSRIKFAIVMEVRGRKVKQNRTIIMNIGYPIKNDSNKNAKVKN